MLAAGEHTDNRSRILVCALQLFASRGYDAVGVQEIVDAAGITKPTLYHYFGSKRGLLETLLTENLAELLVSLERAADYQGDVTRTLNEIMAVYFEYARGHRLFYRMQLAMWFAPPGSDAFQAVAQWNDRQQQLVEGVFARASDDHGNMRGRQRAYAATFLGLINTYVGLALNEYVALDDNLARRAVHQFMHGIFS
jgi:AcrR family transcriptional regulator